MHTKFYFPRFYNELQTFLQWSTQICFFATLIEKKIPFFSFIHQMKSKKETYIKPNSVQSLYFLREISKTLLQETENHAGFFAELPQNQFLSQLKWDFSFMAILSKTSENLCSVMIKNFTIHSQLEESDI